MTYWLLMGDCVEQMRRLADKSIHCCVTSPPYFGLRSYLDSADPLKPFEVGLEDTPETYVARLVDVFREVRRVLRDDGTLWLNLGDSYAKDKNRLMIPARVALALQDDGWILRDEIVWHKPRTTPSSVKDRTCAAHEMLYVFAKSAVYHYDYLAIEEPAQYAGVTRKRGKAFRTHGKDKALLMESATQTDVGNSEGDTLTVRETRRKRSVWSVSPQPYKQAHFATFPPNLIEPCILAGCPVDGIVLDPFGGSGTTAGVALKHGRHAVLCELNVQYESLVAARVEKIANA